MVGNGQNSPSPTPQRFIWKRLIVGIVMFAFSIFLLAGLPQSLFDMIAATPEARRWAVVIAGSLGLVALFSSIFDINIRAAASIPGLSDSSAETVGATAFFLLFVLGGVMFFPELKDDGKVDDQIDRAIVRAMQALTLEEALLNGMRPVQIVAQIVTGNDPGRVADELQKNRKDGAWVLIEGQEETNVRGPIPVSAQDRIRRVYFFDRQTLQRRESNPNEPLRSTDALIMSIAEFHSDPEEARLEMMLYLNEPRLTELLTPNQKIEGPVVPQGEVEAADPGRKE